MLIDLQKELFNASQYLTSAGISHARLEAELLLSKILHISREKLYSTDNIEMLEGDYTKFLALLSERKNQVPIAYLLGNKEFMSLAIFVDKRVLVPRPETELIVEKILSIAKKDFPCEIIDLGTGSGNLAVSMAHYLPKSTVVATDVSKDTLQVAEINIEKYNLKHRVKLFKGRWFAPLKSEGLYGKIDFIVSNPPYLDEEEMNSLPKDVEYEPKIALDGGLDGLKFYREIIEGSSRYLKSGGYLILEMGIRQKKKIFELIEEIGAYGIPEAIKDYSGFDRIIVAQKR